MDKKRRRRIAIAAIAVVGIGAYFTWDHYRGDSSQELRLHGTVDLRSVELRFNNSQRVAAILVNEGDHVKLGQVLGRLDTRRLEPLVAQAAAQVAAEQAAVSRLQNGSRPEEVAQARANVASAAADVGYARAHYERLLAVSKIAAGAVSRQDIDQARANAESTEARLAVNSRTFDLAVAGPRIEDIAEAQAKLQAGRANLALLRQQLAEAELLAPLDAVVRSRLIEPGELASPQQPAFSLAITDPKWVRAYVAEPDLGWVRSGMKASISVDTFPERRFVGRVGFISPSAEFTPKSVQMEELRSSLVYEVRVFVDDPRDELRLGMPATVRLAPAENGNPEKLATREQP